nr:thiol:disulfide interchange protein [Bacteroidota bacterium]
MKNIFRLITLLIGVFALSSSTAQVTDPVKWKLSSTKISNCEYEIIFTGIIEEHWHVYSLTLKGDDGPMPSNIYLDKSNDYEAMGKPTEGAPITAFDKVFEMDVAYFEKTVTFKQKMRLKANKEIIVKGKYEYQACTEEKCIFPPATPFEFKLAGNPECTKGVKLIPIDQSHTGSSVLIDSEAVAKAFALKHSTSSKPNESETPASPAKAIIKKYNLKPDADDTSLEGKPWWSILLTGFLWGFAALFTPCVFPLIPMNVSFFLKRSKTKAKGKLNAILYALSIIIIFVSLGLGISAIWGGGALNTFAT